MWLIISCLIYKGLATALSIMPNKVSPCVEVLLNGFLWFWMYWSNCIWSNLINCYIKEFNTDSNFTKGFETKAIRWRWKHRRKWDATPAIESKFLTFWLENADQWFLPYCKKLRGPFEVMAGRNFQRCRDSSLCTVAWMFTWFLVWEISHIRRSSLHNFANEITRRTDSNIC